MIHFNEVMC